MASLLGRQSRRWEVSVHEATIALAEYQAIEAFTTGTPQKRWGFNRFTPTYPTTGPSALGYDVKQNTVEVSNANGGSQTDCTAGTPGADTITFAVTGTINLAAPLPALSTNIEVQGPGAQLLTVRRDSGGKRRQARNGDAELSEKISRQ